MRLKEHIVARHVHKWELLPVTEEYNYDTRAYDKTLERKCTECGAWQQTRTVPDLPRSLWAYADVDWR